LKTSYLENKINESKRAGFFEFNGTLFGEFNNGTFITLNSTSYNDEKIFTRNIYINITTKLENIFISEEVNSNVVYLAKEIKNYNLNLYKFDLKLQSELTTEIADEIYKINSCKLPTFKEAKVNHVVFINSLLEFYNKLSCSNLLQLPIT
jgi:hypothetical protein